MMEDNIYIKKLRDKISENPASKLFLSLAWELWKRDRGDEAITILLNGIERNPDFLTARLTLVKWYIKKGMFSYAEREFKEIKERFTDSSHDKIEMIERALNSINFLNRFLDAVNKRFSNN